MDQLLSLGDVARLLNIAPYRISYAISVGLLPEPSHRFLDKRCFDAQDVKVIAEHFGIQTDLPTTPAEEDA